MPPVRFHVAREARELEQVHALHYQAFVEEIPQHAPNADGRHVDRFHDENVYFVAVDGETVIGSIALRARRPFSLDQKLPDLDAYLPPQRRFCEVRLLNIRREHRAGRVLPGLLSALFDYAMHERYDCALISATTRQLKLYAHLGFVPFGPLVGSEEAPFQPMYLTLEAFRERAHEISSLPPVVRGELVNLTAGPAGLHRDVVEAFETTPLSHRSPAFVNELQSLKQQLCTLVNARHVQVLLGSGTLANDAIAAQLAGLGGHGMVISNGEFGERLADHARRANLSFDHVRRDWGAPASPPADQAASRRLAWLWVTACETSTGVLNDLSTFAQATNAKLILDCVSAIGAIPLDLSNVWLASAASGKALAAYPGLSMVFHREPIATSANIPRYLDLALYACEGVPFTHSSNLIRALSAAVQRVDWPRRYEQLASTGQWLRARLRAAGFTLIGEAAPQAPHVITIELPSHIASAEVARTLERAGFLVAHASAYLRDRNWIQLCLMGEVPREALPALLRELGRCVDGPVS